MIINVAEGLSTVKEMVKEIADEYLTHLMSKAYFEGKLVELNVEIQRSTVGRTRGYFSGGYSEKSEMIFFVNSDDSQKFVAFVIAHEFAHLLFFNSSDAFAFSGEAKDESKNLTAITRIFPDGSTYGSTLEELVADYLAHYIVDSMDDYDDLSGDYKKQMKSREYEFQLISEFEKIFGKPLYESKYIDEYKDVGNNNCELNLFWQSIVSYSFKIIIDEFDEQIGEKSFQCFNEKLERYIKGYNLDLEPKRKIKETEKEELMNDIRYFSKKRNVGR